MKQLLTLLLVSLMLIGCANPSVSQVTIPETEPALQPAETTVPETAAAPEYISRFDSVTEIILSDDGVLVDTLDSGADEDCVVITRDIVYYEDRNTYDSGNPYGEGSESEKHPAEEAAAHTVVNITQPGAYRISGKLSAGQIRVDLGDSAYYDPNAVVELILDNADITCTVAPAILFQNVYECDGEWSEDTAVSDVDTSEAGAHLILEGSNTVTGSHVAKIYKDAEGEKKLWKQDGAIYSYMSLNVFGPGSLELTADNEGLDTQLHLTVNSGNIHIYSQNDGINTNEDGVSVTTINGGNLTIFAGLGVEGDGIDSNGYLVINGGSVVASANPASDAGLDSDLGSFINGGTVIAMGSAMDWAESDSDQVTMNLQFAQQQKAGSKITLTKEDGTEIFSFASHSQYARNFSGLILSHPYFRMGETYHIYLDGVQMCYTGTDVGRSGPGMGNPMSGMPEAMEFPEGQIPVMPEGFDPSQMGGGRGQHPQGDMEHVTPPEAFDGQHPGLPEGDSFPQDAPFGAPQNRQPSGQSMVDFYMHDKVNAFSGVQSAK